MDQKRYEEIQATIGVLVKTFPKCFWVWESCRRPLKIGIDRDIRERLNTLSPAALSAALQFYCNNPGYRRRILKGAWRIDLDGRPAGSVTAEQEASAKAQLAAREVKAAARNESAKGSALREGLAKLKAAAQARHPQ
jgi:ProP effector